MVLPKKRRLLSQVRIGLIPLEQRECNDQMGQLTVMISWVGNLGNVQALPVD
jgi:hypothetical protein